MSKKWLPIPYAPDYRVSRDGRVESRRNSVARLLKGCIVGAPTRRERRYTLQSPDGTITRTAAQLVADVYLGGIPDGLIVDYVDGDTMNASAENLFFREVVRHQSRMVAVCNEFAMRYGYDALFELIERETAHREMVNDERGI